MAFGRPKKDKRKSAADSEAVQDQADAGTTDAGTTDAGTVDTDAESAADAGIAGPNFDRSAGPFDIDEAGNIDDHVDLGAILVPSREGLALRLEVEEQSQRVVAVTLDFEGSSLQLQAFAAPRSEGLWDDIRGQIDASVTSQHGTTEEVQGTFGTEVVAKLPAQAEDGSHGFRAARFVGVDGPRWFLRGVFGGDAALERDAAVALEELFRSAVIVRGEDPMPPRDLLPLRLPPQAEAAGTDDADASDAAGLSNGPERGPEITQIG